MKNKFFSTETALTYDDVLLVPAYNGISSRTQVDLSVDIAGNVLTLPFMSASMDTVTTGPMAKVLNTLGCMGIVHRFQPLKDRIEQADVSPASNLSNVGIAVGLNDDLDVLSEVDTNVLLSLDVAHADSTHVYDYFSKLRKRCPNHVLMAGSIVTAKAAKNFDALGADVVRCGIGGGSACTTREVTGFGFPNVTAVMNIREAVNLPIIADGGIRKSDDIAKAIAAGASCVMMGSLLAGTDEAPGEIISTKEGRKKVYQGMASNQAQIDWRGGLKEGTVAEGISGYVNYKGSVKGIIDQLAAGLRSSLTYAGAENLKEFYELTQFIKVTPMCLTSESKTRL